jgi:putative FmdB family regulatory protein
MPTYDYACPSCGQRFEARHSLSDPAPPCPACGSDPQRLILSAPAVHGHMAHGREAAVRSLQPQGHAHGKDCPCCH